MLTDRSRLRRQTISDFQYMRILESDPQIMCFTPARVPQSEQQTHERLIAQVEAQKVREPFGIWLAEDKYCGDFLGWFMLLPIEPGTVELGFMLVQAQWSKGLATEIASALIGFGKTQGLRKIIAKTDTANLASQRVLRKLGFQLVECNSNESNPLEEGLKEFALKLMQN